MNTFTFIFLIALAASYGVQFWLSKRQTTHVTNHRDTVPEAFKNTVSLEEHQKAADYTIDKEHIGNIDGVISIILMLILTLGGGISLAFGLWNSFGLSPLLTGLGAIASIFLVMHILELPTTIYQTFVIEDRYGFNKNTPKQFITDQFIQLGLMFAIGLPLLAVILWIMENLTQ